MFLLFSIEMRHRVLSKTILHVVIRFVLIMAMAILLTKILGMVVGG